MAHRQLWRCLIVACLLAASQLGHAQLEGLEDAAEDKPAVKSVDELKDPSVLEPPAPDRGPTKPAKQYKAAKAAQSAPTGPLPALGPWEIGAAVFLVIYVFNVLRGRAVNAYLAKKWAETFTQPGGIYDKNFSSLSAGVSNELMREAGNCYKFYASGRRHVLGSLATLNLRARQDMLSLLWYLVNPTEDTITLEAYMTEASMPPIVVAVGTPKYIRRIANECMDVMKYTKKIQAPKDTTPGWPNDKLYVYTEHSNIFADLFSDSRVLQTFNPTGSNPKAFKLFRSLHFTNDCSEGSHKRVLRFTFALPSANKMEDLAPLMALLPLFIDLVGSYKLPPELKKKAETARAKTESDLEAERRKERLDALAQRKMEKLAEEKAKLARLPPEQRQRAEDKMRKAEIDKQMRKRSIKA